MRRIHWPQTARHGHLVICEVQSSSVPRVQIVLDAFLGAHVGTGPDSSREWAIRVVASFAESWIAQGAQVEMIVAGHAVGGVGASVRARSAAVLDALARLAPVVADDLGKLLNLPECRQFRGGVKIVVTTDVGLRGVGWENLRCPGVRFVVVKAAAFGLDAGNLFSAPLPVVPWIWIDGPDRVASCLSRAGREVARAR